MEKYRWVYSLSWRDNASVYSVDIKLLAHLYLQKIGIIIQSDQILTFKDTGRVVDICSYALNNENAQAYVCREQCVYVCFIYGVREGTMKRFFCWSQGCKKILWT